MAGISVYSTTDPCNSTTLKLQWNNLTNLTSYSGHIIQYKIKISNGRGNNIVFDIHSYLHNNITLFGLKPRSSYFAKITATFQGCSTFNVTAGINVTTGFGIPDPIDSSYVNDTAEGCVITIPKTLDHRNVAYRVTSNSSITRSFEVFQQNNETSETSTSYKFSIPLNQHTGARVVDFKVNNVVIDTSQIEFVSRVDRNTFATAMKSLFQIQATTCEDNSVTHDVQGFCTQPLFTSTQKTDTEETKEATEEENAISSTILASAIASPVLVVGIAAVGVACLCKRKQMPMKEAMTSPGSAYQKVEYTPTGDDILNLTDTTPTNGVDATAVSCESRQVINALYGEIQEVSDIYTEVQSFSSSPLQAKESIYAVSSKQKQPRPTQTATTSNATAQQNEMHDETRQLEIEEKSLYASPAKKQLVDNVLYGSIQLQPDDSSLQSQPDETAIYAVSTKHRVVENYV